MSNFPPTDPWRAGTAASRRPVVPPRRIEGGPVQIPARRSQRKRKREISTSVALAPWVLLCAAVVGIGVYYHSSKSNETDPATLAERNRFALPSNPDPVANFNETRIGHVLFVEPDGRHCRRVLFDNETGGFSPAGDIECLPEDSSVGAAAEGRMNAIRDGFRR